MDVAIENLAWEKLTYEEKNHQLFLREKALLAEFLEHGAISQAQHDKSLHDLIEKWVNKTGTRPLDQKGASVILDDDW